MLAASAAAACLLGLLVDRRPSGSCTTGSGAGTCVAVFSGGPATSALATAGAGAGPDGAGAAYGSGRRPAPPSRPLTPRLFFAAA